MSNETVLRWWRIELDEKGKLRSCTAVEAAAEDGRLWFYVQACDAERAGRLAWNAYHRVVMRQRRARLIAEGKCGNCGRDADRGHGKRCTVCIKLNQRTAERALAKARGEEVPALDRNAARAVRKADERAALVASAAVSTRLEVLLEVADAWRRCETNNQFSEWLKDEVMKLQPARVA